MTLKRFAVVAATLLTIGLIAWFTGLVMSIYHAGVLSIAFLADYLTPNHYTRISIDQAWSQWWQIGIATRWARYQQDHTLQKVTGAYALLLGLALIAAIYKIVPWQRMSLKASAAHGTAHWADGREARPFFALQGRRARRESQLPLGRYKGHRLTLKEKQLEEHVLIVGPTGKGKTAGLIAPGILSEHGSRSLVIIDPKQELVRLTAGAVAQHMRVKLFAPTQPERSQQYNPLAFIKNMEDAEEFAACWVSNTGRSSDPFWDRNTELLITAAVLHLHATEPTAPFSRLADLLAGTSFEDMDKLLSRSPSEDAQRIASTFMKDLKLNEKTAGGVFTDVAGRFFRIQNPKIRAVTAHNDLDFSGMVDEPTALYLSIPASSAERLQPLMACLLMQMFSAFVERAEREPMGRLPRGVTCYLDEFANAGRIPHMSQRITMLRSSRVALVMAIQNYAQLTSLYGEEHKQTILSNASTHIVLPGAGQDEAEFYSRRIGNMTAIGQTMNRNALAREGDINQGQQEIGRKLIMPEEIRTMKRGQILLLSDTIAPLKIWNIPYYRSSLARRANLPFLIPITSTFSQPPDQAQPDETTIPNIPNMASTVQAATNSTPAEQTATQEEKTSGLVDEQRLSPD